MACKFSSMCMCVCALVCVRAITHMPCTLLEVKDNLGYWPSAVFLGFVPQGYMTHEHLRVILPPPLISLDPETMVECYSGQVHIAS